MSTSQRNTRVIHVHDDTHARAKRFCEAANVSMLEWIASLVDIALAAEAPEPPAPPAIVPRRALQRFYDEHRPAEARPPWESPPFWKAHAN